jgi:hypothetical protein
MTAEINMKEIIETARRDLERNLFESNKATLEFQEVRKDERGNFVPIDKELTLELSGNQYFSIGRSRGEEYYEEYYPERLITTKTGKEIKVDNVYIRIGVGGEDLPPVRIKRLKMMGRYNVPNEEVYDAMSRYQAEIYMSKVIVFGKERYALAIKNVGGKGQVIKVYDEKGNKIGDIDSGEELVAGKGTYYLEFPGTYLLEGPDYSIADKNVFLKITLS